MKQGPADIRFTVDHMLIKLGKYLRILGFDADWNPALRTHELILQANREHRIFLTRNRQIGAQYPEPERYLVMESDDPSAQFDQAVSQFDLETSAGLFSQCIRCNRRLNPVEDKEAIRGKVHPNVYAGYEHFYTCPACGTVFWHGSHVRNTCRKLRLFMPE